MMKNYRKELIKIENDISQWDLLEFLQENKIKWFTTKELILNFDTEITDVEMVKFNAKLRRLVKSKYVKQRVCRREIAWRHEFEYRAV